MVDRKLKYPPELVNTTLHRLLIERNLQPQEAPSGKVKIATQSVIKPAIQDKHVLVCEATLTAYGESQDSGKRAFTAECTIIGSFKLDVIIESNDDVSSSDVMTLANYLHPIAAETIEAQLLRTGFGFVAIPRHFDDVIAVEESASEE